MGNAVSAAEVAASHIITTTHSTVLTFDNKNLDRGDFNKNHIPVECPMHNKAAAEQVAPGVDTSECPVKHDVNPLNMVNSDDLYMGNVIN